MMSLCQTRCAFHSRGDDRHPPVLCTYPGCGTATRRGKPYCTAHIEHMPLVQEIQRGMVRYEREVEALCAGRIAARAFPLIEADIVAMISWPCLGVTTAEVAKRIDPRVSELDISILARRLRKRGLLETKQLLRGGQWLNRPE